MNRHVLKIFDESTMHCKQKVDVGIYHSEARFFFILDKYENNFGKILDTSKYLSRHPQVAMIQKFKSKISVRFTSMTRVLIKLIILIQTL